MKRREEGASSYETAAKPDTAIDKGPAGPGLLCYIITSKCAGYFPLYFDFTLNRGRDGPKYFLQDYRGVLLASACAGYNVVVAGNDITRAGCWRMPVGK